MMKCYAVRNIGSREMISPWTTDEAQANEWAAESEMDETEPMVEVISEEWTDRDALQAWLDEHKGDQGWLGVLTGDLAAADDERYTQADDVLGCVRLREGK